MHRLGSAGKVGESADHRRSTWHSPCSGPAIMRWQATWLLVLLAGCDEAAPPFDELPLRDALRADPVVVCDLSEMARGRLAARFELARADDKGVDVLADHSSGGPSRRRELQWLRRQLRQLRWRLL